MSEMATSTTGTETFSIKAMEHWYHVYQDIWDAALEEQLSCKREPGNHRDPFAVVRPHASPHRLQPQWQSKELPSKVDLVDLEVSCNWP